MKKAEGSRAADEGRNHFLKTRPGQAAQGVEHNGGKEDGQQDAGYEQRTGPRGMGGVNVAEQLVEGGAHIGLLVGEVDGKGARGYPIHHTAAELQTGQQQQEHAGLEEHQRTGVG